jgi:hypothetical protein
MRDRECVIVYQEVIEVDWNLNLKFVRKRVAQWKVGFVKLVVGEVDVEQH